jgi:N12 class adenine-specific DNA methylase
LACRTGETSTVTGLSARGLETRYIGERNRGRCVVFATGTPVCNTMAEMCTMLRYLAPELLEQSGVGHVDACMVNSAGTVTALELAPDGFGGISARFMPTSSMRFAGTSKACR